MCDTAPRLPLAAAVREGSHLQSGRPRRSGCPDLASADRRTNRIRRDHGDPGGGAGRGMAANAVTAGGSASALPATYADAASADVRLEKLTKRFDEVVAVDAIDLAI